MYKKVEKNKIWFCEGCKKSDKKDCEKCLEQTYADLRELLDKDILDDILDF